MSETDNNNSEWESIVLDRKLTSDETRELTEKLKQVLHQQQNKSDDEEDVNDFLDYATTMISNQKCCYRTVSNMF